MYITTSRNVSKSTKIFAYNLANFLNSIYEHRGKKSIEDVMARAEQLGFNRIIVVSEQKGNPRKLAFINSEKMEWIFPFIIFSVPTEYTIKKIRPIKKEVEMATEAKTKEKAKIADRIASLFSLPKPYSDDTVKFIVSDNKLEFKYKELKMKINILYLLERKNNPERNPETKNNQVYNSDN
jgi:rRNA maturation protein Rpf1